MATVGRLNIRTGNPAGSVFDHTDKPLAETQQFLFERACFLKRPGKSFVKAMRTISHPLSYPDGSVRSATGRNLFRATTMSSHNSQVQSLGVGMRDAAHKAITQVDEWLFESGAPGQTHGVRLLKDTCVDNDCIYSKVTIYIYRLS